MMTYQNPFDTQQPLPCGLALPLHKNISWDFAHPINSAIPESTVMGPSRNQPVKYNYCTGCLLDITTSGSDYSLCILEVISRVFARANFLPLQQIKSLGYKLISCLFPKVFIQIRIQCSFKTVCRSHLSALSKAKT
ncbi:hypothetical protein I79_012505 [Cricetulus griseus]|uniref:Uncharacterized protein n=1 Tax=Cricetulus griseus TaxID=10029 RepID=G3HP04_CRIGR|nr:hypothetical protein I79_012505 [Cricetulus griseus]